ncbi:MAG: PAS domain-containing protein [Alphaproteobacteria bacterium]|nr:PAS domain-containing protein [Alphaproteobacteria bacterium]
MHEKRLTTRLISYWEQIKSEDSFPSFQQLNPSAIDDIWHNCLALQAQPASGDKRPYTYIHCGETIAEAIGKDVTGQTMTTNMKFFPGAKIIKRLDEVVTQSAKTPLMDDGQFVNEGGKVVKYRACLLAFGANDIVTHVVIGVSWRAF